MTIAQVEKGVGCTFSVLGFDCIKESSQVSDKQNSVKHMEMERNDTEVISAMNCLFI